jgi:hypothetical protein
MISEELYKLYGHSDVCLKRLPSPPLLDDLLT